MNHRLRFKLLFIACFGLLLFQATTVMAQAGFVPAVYSGCKPLNIQFTNTSLNATSYNWDFGNGSYSTQINPSTVFTVAGTYQVTLTATGSGGNSTAIVTITVADGPVADFTASNTNVCQSSGVVQFTNNSSAYDSCVWDFGDGSTSNQINPVHIYNLPGQFSVTLVAYDRINNCSSSITKTQFVTVNPLPVAAVSVDDSITCNVTQVFHFSGSGSSISNWLWSFGDGNSSSLQNPSHIYSDSGYFDITLIATNTFGCTDTLTKEECIHIQYNPVPPITAYNTVGCIPLNTSFITTQTNVSAFHWDLGDGYEDSIYVAYHNYGIAGNYTVTLNVTYTNGCSNTNSYNPVIVDSIPQFTYTIADYTGCAPLQPQFINYNSGAPYSWKWYFGDGDSSVAANPVHTYYNDGTYIVSCYATNSSGCSWGYALNAKVTVSSPQAAFIADKYTGCAPLQVNFNNQSVNAVSYQWDFGDGTTSVVANPTHIYQLPGIYNTRLIVVNNNGCTDTLLSSAINVTASGNNFNPLPPITACVPFTINFVDHSSSSSWLWNFGDGTTSVLSSPTHTYTTPGTYNVSLSTTGVNGTCSQNAPNLRTIIINGGVADFSHTENLCPPYVGTFTDSSQNAISWLWDFGDGSTSTLQNPVHNYNSPGYHTVGLTITTPQGCKVSTVKNLDVYFEPLTASTSASTADTTVPMTVQFYSNTVGATYWHWDFGDGDSSSLEDPVHIYNSAGPYTITLTIGNDSCSRSYTYQPQDFGSGNVTLGGGGDSTIVPPIEYHCAPYEVEFNNPFPDAISWQWDFGDGTSSTLENPVHEYITSGAFHTVLVASYSSGPNDTLYIPETYYVDAFNGNFTITQEGRCNGIVATLYPMDTTATCTWELGDGSFSSQSVPVHTYPLANLNYLISLVAVDSNGCSGSSTQTFYSSDINPIGVSTTRACAGDSVQFHNNGSQYAYYLWTFGDGDSSNLENPFHIYNDSGVYVITLTLGDSTGCTRTFTYTNSIQVYKPHAEFAVTEVKSLCSYVYAQLQNLSSGYTYYEWNMGNGVTSTQPVQYAYYYLPGNYTISLTVSQSVCTSTFTWPVPVYVPALSADFTYNQTQYCAPVTQQFTDLSTDAVSWNWSFGDGTTDTVQHPLHIYSAQPASDITLVVEDVYGCTKTITKPALEISHAQFGLSATSGCAPLTVQFNDTSSHAISWLWNFGDGSTSSSQNPTHVYLNPGAYDVQLIVGSAHGCFDTITVNSLVHTGNIEADFTADSLTGCSPLLIQFSDQSVNATSWLWDFGDGSYSSLQHPAHIYTVPGTYTVKLIATDSLGCSDTMILNNPVVINGSVPMFMVSATGGCVPYDISFTNLSTGAIHYEWNFGNGVTDTSYQPVYTFSQSGNYVVSLTTTDSSGCLNTYTLPSVIDANEAPVADFSYSVTTGCTPFLPVIQNKSLYADSVLWDFGDGTFSNSIQPNHVYAMPGTYYISLYVYNTSGCSDSILHAGPFIVNPTPDASFFSSDSSGCLPFVVQFTNTSTNLYSPTYYWDFGNGDTSSLSNPTEIFTSAGSFTVSLMVTNAGGCYDKISAQNLITIYDQNPPPPAKLYTVSVDDTSGINIRWHLMNLNDINYYEAYRLNNATGLYDSIGCYYQTNSANQNMPEINDANVNTSQQSYTYKVLAVDVCGNSVDLSKLSEHTSVFLSGVSNSSAISLSWSAYGGCPVDGYRIYRSDGNSSAFSLIATVDSSTHFYNDLTTYCPFIYYYRIEAIGVCGDVNATAFSNTIHVDHTDYQWVQQVNLTHATVVNSSYVLVEWMAPSVMPFTIIGYDVSRSLDNSNFTFLNRVNGNQLYIEDHTTDVDHQNYYYKVKAVNYCDVINSLSNEGSSILLKGMYDETGKARLRWTSYSNWSSGVDHYVLERLNEFGVWEPLKTTDGFTNSAED